MNIEDAVNLDERLRRIEKKLDLLYEKLSTGSAHWPGVVISSRPSTDEEIRKYESALRGESTYAP